MIRLAELSQDDVNQDEQTGYLLALARIFTCQTGFQQVFCFRDMAGIIVVKAQLYPAVQEKRSGNPGI